jgi:patatin-like phospholipase
MVMRFRRLVGRVWLLVMASAIVAGCGLTGHRDPASIYTPQHPPEPYPLVEGPANAALEGALGPLQAARPRTRPLHILVLCAGGAESAFSAGALVGWTHSGTRPTFDVATGTSSGAIVAAFAFLGPKYDPELPWLFTEITSPDLFRVRPLRYLLRDGAIASARPLERLLEAKINESFLADLREAHARGRRLFIGTTNFETKRLTVWDVGAIASSGRPEAANLVRKIMLASVTWPGFLPPVEIPVEVNGRIVCEQHVDGGAAAQAFVRFGPTRGWPAPDEAAPGWLAGSSLYVLADGKLYGAATPAPRRFFGRILTGVSSLTNSLARADIHHIHTLCLSSGMRFNLIALPEDYVGSKQSLLRLNPDEMRRMFDAAYRLTINGPPWRHTPPGVEPGEEEIPHG